ncbi:MAG: iron ABC transporter substrate-binding protein [Deltaproteobacteria bacterium]|nr:iron ABC transporter substrate-binding protein [Deltaproteobacteria bacterium]
MSNNENHYCQQAGNKMKKTAICLFFTAFALYSCQAREKKNAEADETALSENVTVADKITITDSSGRKVTVPRNPKHVICSGAGCLRYLTYLQCSDNVVAVDSIEVESRWYESRPYLLANPQYKKKPVFGQFRGQDNPELIAMLNPQPQVIFKTYADMGYNADDLANRTGIPVVTLAYGDLTKKRNKMFESLELIGKIMGKEQRASDVIAFFNRTITDLNERTAEVPIEKRPTCYVGGVAFKGAQGVKSTQPEYPPFLFTNTPNAVTLENENMFKNAVAVISPEKLITWNPDYIFIDLSTLHADEKINALYQLKNKSEYRTLNAVKNGALYGLLPYNYYATNYGSVLANCYYTGKLLYPDHFKDISTRKKANEIFEFLVGMPVFDDLAKPFNSFAFNKINLNHLKK